MDIVLIIMLWEISLAGAFIAGRVSKKKKPKGKFAEITEEERKTLNRIQKEQHNFTTYDGTPQDVIDDYD